MATAFQADAFEPTAFQVTDELADQSQFLWDAVAGISGGTSANAERAQSFVPTVGSVGRVRVLVYKVGTPTDNLICEIRTDASSKPSGTVVGSTMSLAASSLTTNTNGRWEVFSVAAPVTIGVKHWVVLRRDVGGAGDGVNAPQWLASSASSYPSGGFDTRNGSTGVWGTESATIDMAFVTLYTVVTAAALPILVMAPPRS